MEFPRLLYRCPGEHQCPGGTFSSIGANDQAEFDKHVAAGWHPTMPDAMETIGKKVDAGKPAPVTATHDSASGDADDTEVPPTRAELEQKATELGIKFAPNIGDKKLAEKIDAALKG